VLDTWPGTLIVVSHDRYLIERVTDQQYAVVGGRLRHLPGGVDEYLGLQDAATVVVPDAVAGPGLSGAERRALEKQVASLDRRLQRLVTETRADHDALAVHDQGDYAGLEAIAARIRTREAEQADVELEWLEAAERLERA
jgi:ATPase subunit of ABC transporter with duplicated ATPase domains